MTEKFTQDFARRDDCLDKMVPSDLRLLIGERDDLRKQLAEAQEEIQELKDSADLGYTAEQHLQKRVSELEAAMTKIRDLHDKPGDILHICAEVVSANKQSLGTETDWNDKQFEPSRKLRDELQTYRKALDGLRQYVGVELLEGEHPDNAVAFIRKHLEENIRKIKDENETLCERMAELEAIVEKLREQWQSQRKALMQVAGQLPTEETPRKVARRALREWCTPTRVSHEDAHAASKRAGGEGDDTSITFNRGLG